MKKIPALFKRELISYFCSPIAYIVLVVFLVISGYFFWYILGVTMEASLRFTLSNMSIILLFISPAITMRLLAEEKRSGTLETLMTDPVTDAEVVLAKFLASLVFYVFLLVPTLSYVFILKAVGNPDMGIIWAGYAGLMLIGGLFLSIGLLSSAVTSNQIISAVVGFVALLLFWVIGFVSDLGTSKLNKIFGYIGFFEHFDSFRKGIIDTRDIIYFVTAIVLFLFITMRVVESRKWK